MANKKIKESKQNRKSPRLMPENKYAVNGLLGIFLVLVFLASSYKVSGDDDFFWHLATGRYIVENKAVPDKDVFGHITSGSEWIPFEWGWDVLTYSLNGIGGYNAILIFRSLAYCLVFFIFFRLFSKFKVNSFLSILLLFGLLVATMDRLSPRPHIITYICFAILLYVLLNYKYIDRDKYAKRLYFLPLIFLVWANSHMGVLAGGLVLFIFTISETIIYFNAKKFVTAESKPLTQAELKKLWIISIVSAAVLLINPHGISTYIYAYGHTKMKMLETVNEWRSPFTGVLDFGITLTMYKLFLYSGVLVLIYSYIRKDVLFGLMFIAMAIYSVRAIRFTVDYNMIMIFFIAVSVNYFVLRIKSHQVQNFMNGNVLKAAAGILLIYLITLIPSNSIYEKMQYYRMFGWGVDGQFLPVQLFDFMKESGIRGTPYNHFGTGGSLVWNFPDQKNFIDSRNLNDEIFNEYNNIMRMAPGFDKKLDERGVDYVVYLDPDLIRRPNDLKTLVTNYFSTNPKWKLVFWDDKSMLFVKDIPKFKEVIEKYEYKVIDPYLFLFNRLEFESSLRKDPETGKKELKRKTDSEPAGFILQNINQISGKILKGM